MASSSKRKTTQQRPEYKALSSFTSDSNSSLDEALAAFTKPVHDAFKQEKEEEELWQAWDSVALLAATTPHDAQGKLTDFVVKLQEVPIKRESGEKVKVWDQVLWKDLPVFGAAMRESLDSHWSFDELSNLSAFLARLTTASNDEQPLSFSLYAIWTLRATFEEPSNYSAPLANQSAAAMWIIYAAGSLWRRSQENSDCQGKMGKPGSRFEQKEWKGFNAERWRVWEDGFLDALEQKRDSQEEKLLKEAVQQMQELSQ